VHDPVTELTPEFLASTRQRIEGAICPAMERICGHGGITWRDDFAPSAKPIERIVSFYDYQACGISVLARLAAKGGTTECQTPCRFHNFLPDSLLTRTDKSKRPTFGH
jgi:hypothetical protein